MDETQETKQQIRTDVLKTLESYTEEEFKEKSAIIEARLFEFANFLESTVALLYVPIGRQIPTAGIIRRSMDYQKIVVLPAFEPNSFEIHLMKIDDPDKDLVVGPRKILQPDMSRCKDIPIERIDIAIVPGIAFDEKGGRLGTGGGYYDRLLPRLSATTRKVSIASEDQVIPQVPMESHDRFIDIIITEKRNIYKI